MELVWIFAISYERWMPSHSKKLWVMFKYLPRKETADWFHVPIGLNSRSNSIEIVLAPRMLHLFYPQETHGFVWKWWPPRMPWFDHDVHRYINSKIIWVLRPFSVATIRRPGGATKPMVFEGAIHRGKAFKLAGFLLKWGCPKCPTLQGRTPPTLATSWSFSALLPRGLCCSTEPSPEKDWKPIKWDRGDRGKEKTVSNNCDGGIKPQPIFARSVPILV